MRKNSELLCDSNLPEGTHFKAISLLLFLLISGIILSLFMMLGECMFHQFIQPNIMKKSQNFRKSTQSEVGQNSRPNSNSGVNPGLRQTNMGSDDEENLQQNQFKDSQDDTFLRAADIGALRYRFSTQEDYHTCPI